MVDVRYQRSEEGILYQLNTPSEEIHAHILLPENAAVSQVLINGQAIDPVLNQIYDSTYLDFIHRKAPDQPVKIEIFLN